MKANNIITGYFQDRVVEQPETFLESIRRARKASEMHIQHMKDSESYDETDFVREFGYIEALDFVEFLYKRRYYNGQ